MNVTIIKIIIDDKIFFLFILILYFFFNNIILSAVFIKNEINKAIDAPKISNFFNKNNNNILINADIKVVYNGIFESLSATNCDDANPEKAFIDVYIKIIGIILIDS